MAQHANDEIKKRRARQTTDQHRLIADKRQNGKRVIAGQRGGPFIQAEKSGYLIKEDKYRRVEKHQPEHALRAASRVPPGDRMMTGRENPVTPPAKRRRHDKIQQRHA